MTTAVRGREFETVRFRCSGSVSVVLHSVSRQFGITVLLTTERGNPMFATAAFTALMYETVVIAYPGLTRYWM